MIKIFLESSFDVSGWSDTPASPPRPTLGREFVRPPFCPLASPVRGPKSPFAWSLLCEGLQASQSSFQALPLALIPGRSSGESELCSAPPATCTGAPKTLSLCLWPSHTGALPCPHLDTRSPDSTPSAVLRDDIPSDSEDACFRVPGAVTEPLVGTSWLVGTS